jgi:hypothetical protein
VPLTIRDVTVKKRLHRLVDELTEAEASDALALLTRIHQSEQPNDGRAIAAGYKRLPQTDEEDAWAQANARDAIRQERW